MEYVGILTTQPELLRTFQDIFDLGDFFVLRYVKLFSGLYFHSFLLVNSGELQPCLLEAHYPALCNVARKIINMSKTATNAAIVKVILKFHRDALKAHKFLNSSKFTAIKHTAQKLHSDLIESLSMFAKTPHVIGTNLCVAVGILLEAASEQTNTLETTCLLVQHLMDSPPANIGKDSHIKLHNIIIDGLQELLENGTHRQKLSVSLLFQRVQESNESLHQPCSMKRNFPDANPNQELTESKRIKLDEEAQPFQLMTASEASLAMDKLVGEEIKIKVQESENILLDVRVPFHVIAKTEANCHNQEESHKNIQENREKCLDFTKPFHTLVSMETLSPQLSVEMKDSYSTIPPNTTTNPNAHDYCPSEPTNLPPSEFWTQQRENVDPMAGWHQGNQFPTNSRRYQQDEPLRRSNFHDQWHEFQPNVAGSFNRPYPHFQRNLSDRPRPLQYLRKPFVYRPHHRPETRNPGLRRQGGNFGPRN